MKDTSHERRFKTVSNKQKTHHRRLQMGEMLKICVI